MSVVFMKYTDSFVLFQCKCNHTTDSISPRRTAAAQRGDWKTSACSVSPRGLRGPRAVVGVGTGDTKFSCFSQTLPCSQPSCGFSFCVLTFQTSHTYSFSHSHSFFLVLSHSHLFSHTLTYSHVLTLTCSLSHTRPHTCSHTHALVHTQAFSPLFLSLLPFVQGQASSSFRASNGSLPWGLLSWHSHLFSDPAESCSCLPGVWFL